VKRTLILLAIYIYFYYILKLVYIKSGIDFCLVVAKHRVAEPCTRRCMVERDFRVVPRMRDSLS